MPFKRSLIPLGSLILALVLAVPASAGDGFWTPVGPTGLFTSSGPVATHPAAPRTVWINAYKSTNRGNSWTWAGAPYPSGYVSSVAADPSMPGALWAATATEFLHTRGNGAPWQRVSGPTYAALLGATETPGEITTSLAAPQDVFLKVYRRLLGSFDGGVTWRTVFEGGENSWIVDVVPTAPSALNITVNSNGANRLFKTRDAGLTWTPLPCPFSSEFCEIGRLTLSQGALFTAHGPSPAILLRSLNGGLTWQEILQGEPEEPFSEARLYTDPHAPGALWMIVWTSSGQTLWLSSDNGTTWTRRAKVPVFQIIAAGPEPGVLYANSPRGFARSTNGGRTWNDVFPVLYDPDRPPSRVAFQPGHPARMAFVYGHRMFLSDSGGAAWRWLPAAPSGINDVILDPADPNRMTAVGSIVATTADGGKTWRTLSGGYSPEMELAVRARGKLLYAGGCGVLRSRDDGKTWAQVLSCSSPRDRRALQTVQKLVAEPTHPDLVFALTFLDREYYPNHGPLNGLPSILWRSRDGGRTWKNIANDLDSFGWDAESSRLWLVRGATLSASDDLGTTWRTMAAVPLERPDLPVTDLAVPPGLPGTLYLTGGSNLLRTQDEGRHWEIVGAGADALLTLAPDDPRTLYALTHQGVFRLRIRP